MDDQTQGTPGPDESIHSGHLVEPDEHAGSTHLIEPEDTEGHRHSYSQSPRASDDDAQGDAATEDDTEGHLRGSQILVGVAAGVLLLGVATSVQVAPIGVGGPAAPRIEAQSARPAPAPAPAPVALEGQPS